MTSTNTRRYRVAIVGGAGMWGRHYLTAAVAHEQCDTILVDTSDRRDEFAEHNGVTDVYRTLDELFAVEVPDVVCCILPVQVAPPMVLACVEAGVKVVSCEKPIAVELAEADKIVDVCRENGVAFGCATAHWEVPLLRETAAWLASGEFGEVTGVAIPGGLPVEVSGAGCVQLTQMRGLTGAEIEWVEGYELPSVDSYRAPEASDIEADCPAYGRLGLSNGVICEIPEPRDEMRVRCRVSVTTTQGRLFLQKPAPIILHGEGASATPIYPDFLDQELPGRSMAPRIQSLFDALDAGDGQVQCSGHDYRQALEAAIAIKQSAANGHERVSLPLADRSQKIFPHPYRMRGGDVAGYDSIGYESAPQVDKRRVARDRSS